MQLHVDVLKAGGHGSDGADRRVDRIDDIDVVERMRIVDQHKVQGRGSGCIGDRRLPGDRRRRGAGVGDVRDCAEQCAGRDPLRIVESEVDAGGWPLQSLERDGLRILRRARHAHFDTVDRQLLLAAGRVHGLVRRRVGGAPSSSDFVIAQHDVVIGGGARVEHAGGDIDAAVTGRCAHLIDRIDGEQRLSGLAPGIDARGLDLVDFAREHLGQRVELVLRRFQRLLPKGNEAGQAAAVEVADVSRVAVRVDHDVDLAAAAVAERRTDRARAGAIDDDALVGRAAQPDAHFAVDFGLHADADEFGQVVEQLVALIEQSRGLIRLPVAAPQLAVDGGQLRREGIDFADVGVDRLARIGGDAIQLAGEFAKARGDAVGAGQILAAHVAGGGRSRDRLCRREILVQGLGQARIGAAHHVGDPVGILHQRVLRVQGAVAVAQIGAGEVAVGALDAVDHHAGPQIDGASICRRAGAERNFLAAVALGVEVRDIVAGGRQRPLVSVYRRAADAKKIAHVRSPVIRREPDPRRARFAACG